MFLNIALAVASAALAGTSLFSNVAPPTRFQGDASLPLQITGQSTIEAVCQPRFGKPPAGSTTLACTADGRVVMPNPCRFVNESYARLLCHELGHVNGWPPTHGS